MIEGRRIIRVHFSGAQGMERANDVTLTFRPLRPASKTIFEKLYVTLDGKPAGDV